MSAEQIEFLKRKHGIIDSDPANAPGALNTHGAGDTREKPQQAAYVPPPAPVAAADPSGFSADQLAFLARKKAGDTEIAGAMNTHGAGDTRGQSAPAPAPAYVPPPAPVAAADPSGFSPDQLAFLARKKAGDTEIAGAMNTHGAGDTRGQSAPAPAPVAAPAPAPVAAAPAPGGTSEFSPEQLAFLARKKAGDTEIA
eukprot:gene25815-31587_t